MDIKVETADGETIDIEMQVGEQKYYKKRSLYYWSELYSNSLQSGYLYSKLKKCIVINIVDFKCIKGNQFHYIFKVLDEKNHIVLDDDLEIHFIELPWVNDKKSVNSMNEIEQWMTFLKDYDDEDKALIVEQIIQKKEAIKMAADYLEKVNQDEYVREKLKAIERYKIDQNSREEEAFEEGIEKGREKGREEGIVEGAKLGENKKSIEIAKNLLDVLDNKTIALKTGLSVDQVEGLRKHK